MLKSLSAAIGAAFLSVATAGCALGVLADMFWLGELAVNLRWQLGAAALVSLPFLGFGGSRWRSATAAILVVYAGLPAARLAWAPHLELSAGQDLRVATINVHGDNRETAALERWLQSEQPDVVAIVELSPFWGAYSRGESALAHYPYRVVEERVGSFGVGLFSRLPIVASELHEVGSPGHPYIVALLDVGGCGLEVAVVHTFPPLTPKMRSGRDTQLADVGAQLSGAAPSMVVGDLNATMYSPAFDRFLATNGLVDSRRGIGREPTWMPILGPLGLDLDHILVQEGLQVRARRVGGPIGSDHVPVVADLVLSAEGCVPVEGSRARLEGARAGAASLADDAGAALRDASAVETADEAIGEEGSGARAGVSGE